MTRNKHFKAFRRPVRVNETLTAELNERLATLGITVPGQWKLFVTKTKCGRAARTSETVTVPVWAMAYNTLDAGAMAIHGGDKEYAIYYACHEIAHILAPATRGNVHGPEFMKAFKSICPEHLWHYELGYKPRNAAAAGIRRKGND